MILIGVIRATFVLIFKFELPSLCLVKWIICSKNARVTSLKESWIEMLRDFFDYSYSLLFCTCTVQPFSFAECHWPFGQSMWSASLCTQDVLQWWSVMHRVRQAFPSKLVQAHCEGNTSAQTCSSPSRHVLEPPQLPILVVFFIAVLDDHSWLLTPAWF